jgi:hypothetical protein
VRDAAVAGFGITRSEHPPNPHVIVAVASLRGRCCGRVSRAVPRLNLSGAVAARARAVAFQSEHPNVSHVIVA